MCLIKAGAPCNVIRAWQSFLNEQDCHAGHPDGIWGRNTRRATERFQWKHDLPEDGIAGPNTQRVAGKYGFEYPEIEVPPGNINVVIDISHHQEKTEFKSARKDGILGVFNKATEGLNPKYVDASYPGNRIKAKEAGILWGAYHFGRNHDGAEQANWFLDHAKPDGDTVLMLDLEASMTSEQARDFVTTIREKTGKYPGIYTNYPYLSKITGGSADSVLSKCWLWIAAYNCKPHLPAGWDQYTFWQYTSRGHVDGFGCIDRNFFQGSTDDLQKFWKQESV